MQARRFIQCDVFTPTPTREMLFAGHPTLGSCAAWLHFGGKAREAGIVRQECGVGIVEIDTSDPQMLAFTAPPTAIRPMQPHNIDAITTALEIPRERVLQTAELENGPLWQVMQLDSAETVLALDSSKVRWPTFQAIGMIGAHPPGGECAYEVRMLAPSSGMSEDPITGSLNSALAHWLQGRGQLDHPITVAQGTRINRHGRVAITPVDPHTTRIGGQTHILIEGTVYL